MKAPNQTRRTTLVLSIAAMVWISLIHAGAFLIFGATLLAACVIAVAVGATFCGLAAYLAWEFRQAKSLPSATRGQPTTDVNLVMLSRSHYSSPRVPNRRTRTRLAGEHPATNRITSLHRPPHIDRRTKETRVQQVLPTSPLLDFSKTRIVVKPSAN